MIDHARCAAVLGMSLKQWHSHLDRTIREARNRAGEQCQALMHAGWHFEIVGEHATEPYQWKWRRPGPRGGRLFHSTSQAFNALMKCRQ